jgi:hypothetical protein
MLNEYNQLDGKIKFKVLIISENLEYNNIITKFILNKEIFSFWFQYLIEHSLIFEELE